MVRDERSYTTCNKASRRVARALAKRTFDREYAREFDFRGCYPKPSSEEGQLFYAERRREREDRIATRRAEARQRKEARSARARARREAQAAGVQARRNARILLQQLREGARAQQANARGPRRRRVRRAAGVGGAAGAGGQRRNRALGAVAALLRPAVLAAPAGPPARRRSVRISAR